MNITPSLPGLVVTSWFKFNQMLEIFVKNVLDYKVYRNTEN